MSTARIDRMIRELESEPTSQFFLHLFGLVGLGKAPVAAKVESREFNIPFSLLKSSTAR